MKRLLEKWNGQFIIYGKIVSNLNKWTPKKGEQIKIKLLAKRRER